MAHAFKCDGCGKLTEESVAMEVNSYEFVHIGDAGDLELCRDCGEEVTDTIEQLMD